MATKADITQRDRDAVTLALYECFLTISAQRHQEAKQVLEEADWVKPPTEDWLEWQARRRQFNEPTRERNAKN